jgi:hypothetical protein
MNLRPVTSASNVFRRALCPGSERMEKDLPSDESDVSRIGTLLHQYDADPSLDRSFLKTTDQDLLRVQKELDDQIFNRVSENFSIPNNEVFIQGREKELVALAGTEAETPGTCDRWRFYPNRKLLVIRDAKFGFKETTPAAANFQLRVYAIGGVETLFAMSAVVAITQPRLSRDFRITMAAYGPDDIQSAIKELVSIRAKSRDPNAPLVPGELQCRYCKAALNLSCPAFKEKFAWLSTEIKGRTPAAIERTVADCTDEQLDRILVAIQFADFIKDAARDEARSRLSTGRGLNGWELGKATHVRKIIDASRAVALLQLKGDLTRDEILESSNPSLTKLQDKLREKRKLTFKEAKQIIGDTLQSVIEIEERKPSLIRKGSA